MLSETLLKISKIFNQKYNRDIIKLYQNSQEQVTTYK